MPQLSDIEDLCGTRFRRLNLQTITAMPGSVVKELEFDKKYNTIRWRPSSKLKEVKELEEIFARLTEIANKIK